MSTTHRDQFIKNFCDSLRKKIDLANGGNEYCVPSIVAYQDKRIAEAAAARKSALPGGDHNIGYKFFYMPYFPDDIRNKMITDKYIIQDLPVRDVISFSLTNRHFFWLVKNSGRDVRRRTKADLQELAKSIFSYEY